MAADPVETAVAAVHARQTVIAPTDTVYGLCAVPDDAEVARSVTRLKGRDERMPLALLMASVDTLLECLPELRGRAVEAAARALLPGPLTLVLPNPEHRFRWLTGSRPETLGIRVPDVDGVARKFLDHVGAVLATSANAHGRPDARRLDEVPDELRHACAAEIDGGELPGVPSTVLDLTGAAPRVLREGAFPAGEALARAAAAVH